MLLYAKQLAKQLSQMLITIGVIILLFWLFRPLIKSYFVSEYVKSQERIEQKIDALNDSVRLVKRDESRVIYQIKTLEANQHDLRQLMKRDDISEQQKKYLRELRQTKNLVSSLSARMYRIDSSISVTNIGDIEGVTQSQDSLSFKKGTELTWNNSDATRSMTWDAKLKFDDPLIFNMDYKYKLNLDIKQTRQKDGSVLLNFESDDPNLNVDAINSYVVPAAKQRTRVGQWLFNNRWVGRIAAGTAIGIGGGYAGYKLAQ